MLFLSDVLSILANGTSSSKLPHFSHVLSLRLVDRYRRSLVRTGLRVFF